MIFPINVSDRLRNAGKSKSIEKFSFILFLIVLANLLCFGQLSVVFESLHLPMWLLIVIQILVSFAVGFLLIRIFVVRENDKLEEHKMSKDASISNYYFILDKEHLDEIEGAPIFEYNDGNLAVFVRFFYGENNIRKMKANSEFMQSIYNIIIKYGLECRTLNMPEKFRNSRECQVYTNSLSNIKQDNLRNALADLSEYMLQYTDDYSELQTTTLIVRTINPYQVHELGIILRTLSAQYKVANTSIRSIEFLDNRQMRILMSNYYLLEALDLVSLHVKNVSRNLLIEFKDKVRVLKIKYVNGNSKEVNSQTFVSKVSKL